MVAERRPELDESLWMIGSAGLDIGPFLHQLESLEDGELAACLHANWVVQWFGRVGLTAFWTETAGRGRVWAWYLSESLEDRMTRAGLAGDDRAAAVSDAIARAVREYGR